MKSNQVDQNLLYYFFENRATVKTKQTLRVLGKSTWGDKKYWNDRPTTAIALGSLLWMNSCSFCSLPQASVTRKLKKKGLKFIFDRKWIKNVCLHSFLCPLSSQETTDGSAKGNETNNYLSKQSHKFTLAYNNFFLQHATLNQFLFILKQFHLGISFLSFKTYARHNTLIKQQIDSCLIWKNICTNVHNNMHLWIIICSVW